MPRGASPKREREYKGLVQKFSRSGRYGNRKKEVAARIVNKQRAAKGETKSAKRPTSISKSQSRKRASTTTSARGSSSRKRSTRTPSARRSASRRTTARRTASSRR